MATQRPLKPCAAPRCPELSTEVYCEAHRKERQNKYEKKRGSAASRGYNYRWQKYSQRYRKKHPLCVRCLEGEKLTPSEHVDHIEPVDGPDDPLFWEPTNHQALCQSCHSIKTITEDRRGFGR